MNDEIPAVDYEKEARLQNWVPQEEFKGPKDEWIDAQTFVERGKQINPILRANNERLLRELDKTKKQMEELRTTAEEFKTFQKEAYDRKASALEKEISELREQKKKAITDGDGAKTLEIEDQIDALKEEKAAAKVEQKKEEKPSATTQPDPDLEAWVSENRWYASSSSMADVANGEAARINAMYPSLRGKEFLNKLDEVLLEVFTPEKLGKKSATPPKTMVEGASGGSRSSTSKNAKAYENLPADAKRECDRFVKTIKGYTKEQYCSDYEWD